MVRSTFSTLSLFSIDHPRASPAFGFAIHPAMRNARRGPRACGARKDLFFIFSQRLPLQRAKRASGRTGLTCRRASGAPPQHAKTARAGDPGAGVTPFTFLFSVKKSCSAGGLNVGSRGRTTESIPHILRLTKARRSKFGMACRGG
jgi:hypothetical protein